MTFFKATGPFFSEWLTDMRRGANEQRAGRGGRRKDTKPDSYNDHRYEFHLTLRSVKSAYHIASIIYVSQLLTDKA